MIKVKCIFFWIAAVFLGTTSAAAAAIAHGEQVNAFWLVAVSICLYILGYRFYSAWIATKVLMIDPMRKTPAERLGDGRDFVPTHRWVVFGHHFAAIAGAGPLVGPTLAVQFCYLPGFLWVVIGAVLGGCVQDMVILFLSTRRDGKSLGQIAREELGPLAGVAAMIGTLGIMIISIAVLALVVVNAMRHSPWATSTVAATIPIAMLVGIYMRYLRPGKILEASLLGVGLVLLAVAGGHFVDMHPMLGPLFNQDGKTIAWFIIGYGFLAAVLPVWLLLAPRDYLSTFIKLGTIFLLAGVILLVMPKLQMPAITSFIDGTGPVFSGKLFPFLFITIACGALSGFHSLVASGTTPKLIANEKDIPLIGYGSMALESLVGVMAIIAASILEPGVYFAINAPSSIVGATADNAVQTISSWGFPVTSAQMTHLAQQMGEETLFGRTGGAPSLAVGMAHLFSSFFGDAFLAFWYHFAIMFEALFILTTLDAGTRVGRFMAQDMLGQIYRPLGKVSSYPSTLLASALVVGGWGYFLYIGVIDPYGGVNMLWPLFGIANQILAGIALCIATSCIAKSRQARFVWVTGLPLVFISMVTTVAALAKVLSPNPRVGFLSQATLMKEQMTAGILVGDALAAAPKVIANLYIDTALALVFVLVLWAMLMTTVRIVWRVARGKPVSPLAEAAYEARGVHG
jgi:carbon starvation protein